MMLWLYAANFVAAVVLKYANALRNHIVLDHEITVLQNGDIRIVGVAGDARYNTLREETPRARFVPYAPMRRALMTHIVRSSGDPAAAMRSVREVSAAHDSRLRPRFSTVDELLTASMATERFFASIAGVLSLLALGLACGGLYAAVAYAVSQRGPELAVRMALGATRADIMALILFDKPASELSAIESLQVAEGLAELGGIGPFGGKGLTGSARQALGLDLLNIDIDQANSAASSLTVGKYVADGLFVSAKQDARGQSGAVRIEYEINDSFTVQTEIRQDGDQTVSANWKRDF